MPWGSILGSLLYLLPGWPHPLLWLQIPSIHWPLHPQPSLWILDWHIQLLLILDVQKEKQHKIKLLVSFPNLLFLFSSSFEANGSSVLTVAQAQNLGVSLEGNTTSNPSTVNPVLWLYFKTHTESKHCSPPFPAQETWFSLLLSLRSPQWPSKCLPASILTLFILFST